VVIDPVIVFEIVDAKDAVVALATVPSTPDA